jgi:hypothetical protein
MSIKITIKGIGALQDEMNRAESSINPPIVKRMLAEAINVITQEALSNVRRMFKKKTGNLEKSLVTSPGKSDTLASAWSKAGGRLAPHAHLLEFGHKMRDGKIWLPPMPFYRSAVDAKRAEVRQRINDGIKALLSGKGWFANTWQGKGSSTGNTRGGDIQ